MFIYLSELEIYEVMKGVNIYCNNNKGYEKVSYRNERRSYFLYDNPKKD